MQSVAPPLGVILICGDKRRNRKMKNEDCIMMRGVRVNNLKNVDVRIPRDKFVVVTGVSGSGKSSLAFDTLYAEEQRRYVESMSTYARQFMGRMAKPECDFIEGLPPAIAIEQKVVSRNPRSTVGTSTEIYDYLRMLFARVGHTFSPISGVEVVKHTPDDIVECMMSHETGTRFMVLTPLVPHGGRTRREQLDMDLKQGFSRIEVNGRVVMIEEYLAEATEKVVDADEVYLVIDRLVVNEERTTRSRLVDSSETALYEGDGKCILKFIYSDGREPEVAEFSLRFEADGIEFEEPSDQMFSFNSPVGACPECEGFGRIVGIDENLVIPNTELSVYDGAVVCWRGEKMGEWKNEFVRRAEKYGFPIFAPYYQLTQEQKDLLWHGAPGEGKREMVCID